MVSEAVLVRIAIPALGEKRAMRVGLASFAMQCVLLAVADRPWHLFGCAFLAIPGNLVYPSVSSLVSTTVRPEMVGRALGAVNGVKSLTEGVGPLVFGTLLTMSEKDALPGWPYFIAAIMAALAYQAGRALPGDEDDSDSTMLYSKASLQREEYNSSPRDEDEVCGLLDADAR
jgi:DHA1 family tetracycline resistance protein-like MFS transporter